MGWIYDLFRPIDKLRIWFATFADPIREPLRIHISNATSSVFTYWRQIPVVCNYQRQRNKFINQMWISDHRDHPPPPPPHQHPKDSKPTTSCCRFFLTWYLGFHISRLLLRKYYYSKPANSSLSRDLICVAVEGNLWKIDRITFHIYSIYADDDGGLYVMMKPRRMANLTWATSFKRAASI